MDLYFAQFDGLASAPVIRTRDTTDLSDALTTAVKVIQHLDVNVYSRCYIFKNNVLHSALPIKRTTVFGKEE